MWRKQGGCLSGDRSGERDRVGLYRPKENLSWTVNSFYMCVCVSVSMFECVRAL